MGKQITNFVGLRAKLYAYKIEGAEEKKCKGVKKSVVKRDICFDDYINTLFSQEKQMRVMNLIRCDKHNMYSVKVNKVALSANDDKREILPYRIRTQALR